MRLDARRFAAAVAAFLLVGHACAQSVQVRGPVDVDAPRPQGDIIVSLSLYDAPADGRLLWKSPAFSKTGKWVWTILVLLLTLVLIVTAELLPLVLAQLITGRI